ncbi:MAG: PEP-CTERM sorting domain-containing protein [Pseudomonadota bacterium]
MKQFAKLLTITTTAVLALAMSPDAAALDVELDIDFRDGGAWGSSGRWQSTDGVTVRSRGGRLYRDNRDGFGIRGGEHDEIDRHERLIVDFSRGYYENHGAITAILITDLFDSPDGGSTGESGWVRVFLTNGESFRLDFNQQSDDPNGELLVQLGGAYEVARFVFHASGMRGHEYSVAGFVSVPEPTTLALFGSGLLLAGLARRRRKTAG